MTMKRCMAALGIVCAWVLLTVWFVVSGYEIKETDRQVFDLFIASGILAGALIGLGASVFYWMSH